MKSLKVVETSNEGKRVLETSGSAYWKWIDIDSVLEFHCTWVKTAIR